MIRTIFSKVGEFVESIVIVIVIVGFSSCTQDELQQSTELKCINVNLGFIIDEHPWQLPLTRAATPREANSFTLTVFDSNDNQVFTKSQSKTTDASTFGTLSDIRLAPGTYKFAVVAYFASEGNTSSAEIISTESASIPEDKLYNTHAIVKEVIVPAGDYTSNDVQISVPLCVTSLCINLQDALPEGVSKIRMTINQGGTLAASPISVNPTTGLATINLGYSRTWQLASSDVGKKPSFTIFALLNEFPKEVPVKIEALNSDESQVLFSRTFTTGITLKRAVHHNLYTYLFTGTNNATITFDTWASTEEDLTIK